MTKYDRFIYAIGSFLLTLSLSGCGNEENEYDRSAFYEGGDTVIIEDETVPLSDEMAIKIDRTLYLLKDNNISSVHDLTIQDNVRKRFARQQDRKSTRLNSSHQIISYAVFCLKKKKHEPTVVCPGTETTDCGTATELDQSS